MKQKAYRVIFVLIALVACGALIRDLWFASIAFDPADYNLPSTAQEVVPLRTERTVTFHLQGRKYVTIGRSGAARDGGSAKKEDGTGSSL